jgi:hypothetical protein
VSRSRSNLKNPFEGLSTRTVKLCRATTIRTNPNVVARQAFHCSSKYLNPMLDIHAIFSFSFKSKINEMRWRFGFFRDDCAEKRASGPIRWNAEKAFETDSMKRRKRALGQIQWEAEENCFGTGSMKRREESFGTDSMKRRKRASGPIRWNYSSICFCFLCQMFTVFWWRNLRLYVTAVAFFKAYIHTLELIVWQTFVEEVIHSCLFGMSFFVSDFPNS